MKQLLKVTGILLAMLLCFSSFSIGVSAQYADYTSPAGYDALEHPYVSIDQCGSMVLDYLDDMLAEMDLYGEIDAKLWSVVRYDFRSVDNAFDSIIRIMNSGLVKDAKGLLDLGDLESIRIGSIQAAPRRTTIGRSDIEMVYALVNFLFDNKNIIGRIVDSCWDNGGLVSNFLDINETVGDVQGKIKEAAFNGLFDGVTTSLTQASSLDAMVDEFLYNMLMGVDGFLPGLGPILVEQGLMTSDTKSAFHLSNISFYQLIKYALRAAITQYAQPALLDVIGGLDSSVMTLVCSLLNIDSTLSTEEIVAGILDLEDGYLTNYIRVDDNGIYLQDGFYELVTNLLQVAKGLISDLSLYPNVETRTDEEIAAITDESELVAYLVRTVLVGLIDYADIPASVTTTREVATYFLINVMADKMPQKDYLHEIELGIINPKTDGALEVLADFAYYYLNANTTMNIPEGKSFDETIAWIFNWAKAQWGGVFRTDNLTSTNVWYNIDVFLWQNLFQISWLGTDFQSISVGMQTKTLLFDKIIYAILDWKFDDLMSIFRVNPTGELSKPITTVILNLVKRVINGIFQGNTVIGSNITTFESIVADVSNASDSNKTNLRVIAENLITYLPTYDESIINSVLPLFAKSLAKVEDSAYEIYAPAGTVFTDDDLERILVNQRPGNDVLIKYNEPGYHYFGSEDFSPLYRYYNYKEIRTDADNMLNRYREGSETVTDANITDIAYRLTYYYDRLTLGSADVTQLSKEINEAATFYGAGERGEAEGTKGSSSQFTLKTWNGYMEAYNFAQSVYEEYLVNYNNTLKQSKVSYARELLVEAQKKLKLFGGDADYSQLDRVISMAQTAIQKSVNDPNLYLTDTVEALVIAVNLANAVDRGYDGSDQIIIDEAALALETAYDELTYNPQLAKVETASTVIDKSERLIWGIKEGVTNYISYIQVLGSGILETNYTSNGKGTGTVVSLKIGDDVLETYTVVIYGDIDGNAKADGLDANIAYAVNADLIDSTTLTAAQLKAIDANHDGVFDVNDYSILIRSGLLKATIDQNGN